MALLMTEGFDWLSSPVDWLPARGWAMLWDLPGGVDSHTIVGGRFDGGALQIRSDATTNFTRDFAGGDEVDDVIFGVALNPQYSTNIAANGDQTVTINRSRANVGAVNPVTVSWVKLQLNARIGAWYLTDVKNNTIIASGVHTPGPGWHYWEIRAKKNGASSEVELYCDGVQYAATITVDWSAHGGSFGSVTLSAVGDWGNYGSTGFFDDIYVLDPSVGGAPLNNFLGPVRVDTLLPNGAGATTDWTPSSGANHEAVDEQTGATSPDDDTTYVSASAPGDKDTYAYEDLAVPSGVVFGVVPMLVMKKDDASYREVCSVTRSGGADYDGAARPLSDSYVVYDEVLEQNPDTAAAWTVSEVNGAEFGAKVVT